MAYSGEHIDMMGRRGGGQDKLFYSFNVDDHVPRDHLLRGISRAAVIESVAHVRWRIDQRRNIGNERRGLMRTACDLGGRVPIAL
jgi:hypothetical protein